MKNVKYGDRRERQRVAARELREKLLAELELGPRTMRQLIATFGLEREMIHRALLVLRKAGQAHSQVDRRSDVLGVIGSTWMLTGDTLPSRNDPVPLYKPSRRVSKGPWPAPPRDPLLWALFGAQP